MNPIEFPRRTALSSLGAVAVTGIAPPVQAAGHEVWMTDPHKVLNIYIRMQSDISGNALALSRPCVGGCAQPASPGSLRL